MKRTGFAEWSGTLRIACVLRCLIALTAMVGATAAAQTFPQRPMRMVVGLPAGGSTDIMARMIAARLSQRLGQQMIVDNRPGGNGIIGIQVAVNAQPDGHTLIMAPGSFGTLGSLYSKLPFDVQKDLAPVAPLATSPYVIVVQPTLPIRTVADLIAYAKANPGKLNVAASTPSSLQRLSVELLKRTGGFDMLYVPYKGTGAMMPDVLGGRLHVVVDNVLTLTTHIRSGTLRAIGVTSGKRSPLFPDLPTLAETGVPRFHVVGWFGVFTAAKTPQVIIAKLNSEIGAIVQEPETRERLLAQGAEVMQGSPEDLRKHLAREIAVWSKVIRESGIKAE